MSFFEFLAHAFDVVRIIQIPLAFKFGHFRPVLTETLQTGSTVTDSVGSPVSADDLCVKFISSDFYATINNWNKMGV